MALATGQWPAIDVIAQAVQAGTAKASDLVSQALDTIAKHADHQAIIVTTAVRARQRAEDIDKKVTAGESVGRLAGVPFIAKDNFLAFGAETTAASNILRGFKSPYQATAIERLEAEGAICVAKANLDAFGHGSSTENSDFFVSKHPLDKARVPGGSSGGSAAAVMLDMAPLALGTDSGGSVRLPASFCGAVGYKPTYGLVSRSGIVAMSSSCDVVGPITRTVEDTALVMDILAAKDELDSTTIDRDEGAYNELGNGSGSSLLAGLRIGIIKECMGDGLHKLVRPVIEAATAKLKASGAILEEVSVPSLPAALAVYYIIVPAEISSNLSRYDGQRFGYNYPEAQDLYESFAKSRERGFGKEAKRRIMIGTYVLSSGYYDAYYKRAQTVRTKIINEFNAIFKDYDAMISPTAGITAFPIGQLADDPLQMYFTDTMTVSANLTGVPAISIPAGVTSEEEMPVGLQLMMPQRADRKLLQLARQVQECLA